MRFPLSLPTAFYLFLALALPVPAGEWPAFPVEWPADGATPADVSFLLRAPAGQDGFIRVQAGHLVRPDGSRFRIWGVNASGKGALPAQRSAPIIAAHLARRGINCVRFHFFDRAGTLLAAKRDDTQELDPDALDRLDCFVAELKKRGIYSDINLNVCRTYKAGDGVREPEQLGFGKGATYFDERLLELQREYARRLLTHVNPYTGHAYVAEPAVAVVEFVNENSLVEAWVNNRLLGKQTDKSTGTWHDVPPSYAAQLTEKFNAWLPAHVPAATLARWRREAGVADDAPLPRLRKEDLGKAAKDRFQIEAEFYMEIERNYFRDMAKFLREDLGVKCLLIGNSDHGHGGSGYPLVTSLTQLDIVDGHVYWQHPRYLTNGQGRRTGFEIGNTPMVDEPAYSNPVQLSRTAVAGKPYTVSEVNHPFPAEYAAEGIPILAAYAALQDWDGIFWYTLCHDDVVAKDLPLGHFDLAPDPVKMSQLAAGALLFLRGDVRPAARVVNRSYSHEQVLESLRLPRSEGPYFTPGFPLTLPLRHAVRVASFDGPPTGKFDPVPADEVESDTGELTWRGGKQAGVVAVNTPRSQALIGRLSKSDLHTANLRAEIETPFCAVTVGALDNQPIAAAARLLVTVGSRTANTDMEWHAKRKSLEKWGTTPVRLEPVAGRLILTGLAAAHAVQAQPLDGAGRPLGAPLALEKTADGWCLALGQPPTPWYFLTVERSR